MSATHPEHPGKAFCLFIHYGLLSLCSVFLYLAHIRMPPNPTKPHISICMNEPVGLEPEEHAPVWKSTFPGSPFQIRFPPKSANLLHSLSLSPYPPIFVYFSHTFIIRKFSFALFPGEIPERPKNWKSIIHSVFYFHLLCVFLN